MSSRTVTEEALLAAVCVPPPRPQLRRRLLEMAKGRGRLQADTNRLSLALQRLESSLDRKPVRT